MRREISSAATPFYKVFVLLFFGGGAFFLTLNIIFSFLESPNFTVLNILTALANIAVVGFFAVLFIRLALSWKRVEIDDQGLIVMEANFFVKRVETRVPFENIKRARQKFWQKSNPGTVEVEFTKPTFFGTKIKFVPTSRFNTYVEHPVVNELNRLAARHRSFLDH